MKAVNFGINEIYDFRKDLYKAFKDNHLIMDAQNPCAIDDEQDMLEFLAAFARCKDVMVIGIVDDSNEYCYGYMIFDNIRSVANIMTAEMHLALARELWGKVGKTFFEDFKKSMLFDIVYARIPHIAVGATAIAKRMGFKKTGYIPKALPYKNLKGEVKLYDLNIFVLDTTEGK